MTTTSSRESGSGCDHSEIIAQALFLFSEGYRLGENRRPIDPDKPLIPSELARCFGWRIGYASQVNHLLVVWSLGEKPVGEYDHLCAYNPVNPSTRPIMTTTKQPVTLISLRDALLAARTRTGDDSLSHTVKQGKFQLCRCVYSGRSSIVTPLSPYQSAELHLALLLKL